MRKYKYLLFIGIAILTLAGCGKKDQMPNFFPTPMITEEPEKGIAVVPEDTTEGSDTGTGTEEGVTPAPTEGALHVGKTTTQFVKMTTYNGILNVRSTPSTDGEIVGFLVHTEQIEVIEVKDGWASFVIGNKICYVNAEFLADEKPAYIDPPSPSPTPTLTPTPAPDPNQITPEI